MKRRLLFLAVCLLPLALLRAQDVEEDSPAEAPPPVVPAEESAGTAPPEAPVETEAPPAPPEEAAPPPKKKSPPKPVPQPTFFGQESLKYGSPAGPQTLRLKKTGPKREKDAWRRRIELGFETTQGNSDTRLYQLGFDARKSWDSRDFQFKLNGTYGESDGERNKQNARASAKYRRSFTERAYLANEIQFQYDEIADLDYRVIATVSPGYHLVKKPDTLLSVEVGPGYLAERKGEETDSYFVARFYELIEHRFNESVLGWQSLELLPSLENINKVLVTAEVGVESALTGVLRLRLVAQDRYDSMPADDKKNNDLLIAASLVADF